MPLSDSALLAAALRRLAPALVLLAALAGAALWIHHAGAASCAPAAKGPR